MLDIKVYRKRNDWKRAAIMWRMGAILLMVTQLVTAVFLYGTTAANISLVSELEDSRGVTNVVDCGKERGR